MGFSCIDDAPTPIGANDFGVIEGEALAVLRTLPSASVDAVITDPPYNSGGRTAGERARSPIDKYKQSDVKIVRPDFEGDGRDQRAYAYWSNLWLSECLRIARPGSPICLFSDWRQIATTIDMLQAAGWIWRGIVVWDKTEGARPCVGRFTSQAEYVIWGSHGRMPRDRGVGVLPGVYRFPVKQSDKHHLCGKPTPLMESLLRIAPPGSHILDPFAGSGTTGVAAERGGYGYTLIEQLGENVEIARARIRAARAGVPYVPSASPASEEA